jgi:hypothetical protein
MKHIWIVFLLLTPSCFGEMKNAIRTESGLISGIAGRDSTITVFKGIPYAEPPVGNLRWEAPQLKSSWRGIRKSVEFGNGCAQTFANASYLETTGGHAWYNWRIYLTELAPLLFK